MADYAFVRASKLQLKGEKRKKKSSKNKEKRQKSEQDDQRCSEDTVKHGGWVCLNNIDVISGSIAIEVLPYCYIRALDNGLLVAGEPHQPGEPPLQEEILTAIKISETHRAFKSGYGKYLSLDHNGRLVGRSDAIGQKEQFEPVFQDGKIAISAYNSCFLSPDDEMRNIVARSAQAGPNQFVKIRSNVDPEEVKREEEAKKVPEEEKGTLEDAEEKYIKKFQAGKIKSIGSGGIKLKAAKEEGRLHAALLDRREKMKSDKFCK